MLFCQVSTSHIQELMQSPDLVLELIQDVGFTLEDNLFKEQIISMIESRYQGNEQSYTLEHFASSAQLVLLDYLQPTELNLLFKKGKPSGISHENHEVYVLSPAEVKSISQAFNNLDLPAIQYEWLNIEKLAPSLTEATAEQVDLFWTLFPGIFQFFHHAARDGNCILRLATSSLAK